MCLILSHPLQSQKAILSLLIYSSGFADLIYQVCSELQVGWMFSQ